MNKSASARQRTQPLRGRPGVELAECFQCRKCSAGCTMAEETDLLPHALIEKIRAGQDEAVLRSHHLWLCVGCGTCSARCPNRVDLCNVIDRLRQIALERGVEPAEPEVVTFHQTVLETLERHGRLYELGMIARLKLRTGQYTKDAGMGLALLRRGKLRLLASRVRNRRQLAALFDRGGDGR